MAKDTICNINYFNEEPEPQPQAIEGFQRLILREILQEEKDPGVTYVSPERKKALHRNRENFRKAFIH